MRLDTEIATYRARLAELGLFEGKFVLIRGAEVIDTFASYEDALRQGYRQFGLDPFLVKQIQTIELVQCIPHVAEPRLGA
ncbi:hypothetical protein [Longimicrobium sp.]|uniref:hypothetical protein n=1 Tax=Longimicrobium sp. TaxID=2029185 RepID=UPI002D02AD61|nr:hypothetical protein [Longimicrobium sp.]HSU13579.1 hypothetical protein [Longimicrobium sp.]